MARQQTLRAALDWRFGLLSDDERKVFRQLSVFAGGFTLEAAEAVVSGADGDLVAVLDLLNTLVDKSMVLCVGDATDQVRYGMLDTLQQYGRERLVESAEMEAVREAHLRYFLAFAEEASPKLLDRSLAAIEQVEREFANLRLAIAWASSSDVNRCLCIAVALEQYWVMRGRFSEGREALTHGLAADAGDPVLRSRALAEMARCGRRRRGGGGQYAWQAVAVGRQAGPCVSLSRGLAMAGNHSMWLGELARARALFEERASAWPRRRANPSSAGMARWDWCSWYSTMGTSPTAAGSAKSCSHPTAKPMTLFHTA